MCILIFDDMYHLLLVKTILAFYRTRERVAYCRPCFDSDVWSRIRAKHNFWNYLKEVFFWYKLFTLTLYFFNIIIETIIVASLYA